MFQASQTFGDLLGSLLTDTFPTVSHIGHLDPEDKIVLGFVNVSRSIIICKQQVSHI
jgi:hypothetical protein